MSEQLPEVTPELLAGLADLAASGWSATYRKYADGRQRVYMKRA
jgi:hypothetical protein